MSNFTLTSVLLLAIASSGCSKILPKLDEVIPDNRREYTRAQTLPDLEVPPDLSTEAIRDRMTIPEGGEAARFSTYQERRAEQQRATEVENSQNSAIKLLENEHVLAVSGAPVQIWPKLETFFEAQGYTLELNDVELGILETSWIEDDSQLSRNKFKIFAENGEDSGTTVLYISQEGQELVPQGEDLVWQRGARDVDAERVLVESLHTELSGGSATGTAQIAAQEPGMDSSETSAPTAGDSTDDNAAVGQSPTATGEPRHAELVSVGGGKFYLTVAEDFARAWKTTGRALEDAGVDVKDSDKGRGLYIVAVSPTAQNGESESGVWNKLKFWDQSKAAEYQVSLTGVGEKTEVVVLDKNGRWETGDQAGVLLNKLHDALNSGRI
jgi:outer membrane protein assembly factor BamC